MKKLVSLVKPDLGQESVKMVSRLASLETGISRIRLAAANIGDDPELADAFSFLGGLKEEFKEQVFNGAITDPRILNALNTMGLTSEMAVRVFSGAAVTPEEFDRYFNRFIGSLRGGQETLMTHLDNLEIEFRTQRENLIQTSIDPRGLKPGVGGQSEESLVEMMEAGSKEAERVLSGRGYFERLRKELDEKIKANRLILGSFAE